MDTMDTFKNKMAPLLLALRSLPRKADTLLNSTVLFRTDPLANLSALEAGLAPRTAAVEERAEKRIVERILAAYHEAKADQKGVPPAYKPGGEWDHGIKTTRQEYLTALERRDVGDLSRLLRNFFRNSGANGLLTLGQYAETAAASARRKRWFVHCLLQDYATWKELTGNTNPRAVAAPTVGNAWGYFIDKQLVMPGACRHSYFAHRAYALLCDLPGSPVVAEIGGGFGGFAYFLLSALDRCRYVDFDLPEILLLQQYYLMSAFPEKRFLLYGADRISSRAGNQRRDPDAELRASQAARRIRGLLHQHGKPVGDGLRDGGGVCRADREDLPALLLPRQQRSGGA